MFISCLLRNILKQKWRITLGPDGQIYRKSWASRTKKLPQNQIQNLINSYSSYIISRYAWGAQENLASCTDACPAICAHLWKAGKRHSCASRGHRWSQAWLGPGGISFCDLLPVGGQLSQQDPRVRVSTSRPGKPPRCPPSQAGCPRPHAAGAGGLKPFPGRQGESCRDRCLSSGWVWCLI